MIKFTKKHIKLKVNGNKNVKTAGNLLYFACKDGILPEKVKTGYALAKKFH